MKNGRCFEGDSIFNRHRLESKSVRLTFEEIRFIENYVSGEDFSYNLRSIVEYVMRNTKNPEKT